jgi:Group II intron, maturase-specific domain
LSGARLKVNEEKSGIRQPHEVHFLGFRFQCRQTAEGWQTAVLLSAKAERRLRTTVREMTPPNWKQSLTACMKELSRYLNGWVAHFRLCTEEATKALRAIDAHIHTVHGDFYAGEWVSDAWSKTGISYCRSPIAKNQIYLETQPLFSREAVSLPDHPRLVRVLRLLERRVHRSGRDTVDHGRNGHDDYANAMAGALRVMSAYAGGAELPPHDTGAFAHDLQIRFGAERQRVDDLLGPWRGAKATG